jgi:hypothetical protein
MISELYYLPYLEGVEQGSDGLLMPWEENPYTLVSWWNVEKFSADIFFTIGQYLCIAQRTFKDRIRQEGNSAATVLGAPSSESKDNAILNSIKEACSQIGLTVSTKCVTSLIRMRNQENVTMGQVIDAIHTLEQTITWEMEDRLFMYINPNRAARYDQPELFGKDVNTKFSTIQFDLVEAGNCYATGRSTAVVFHLMRIMETGVQAFGTKLGVTLADEKNWQNILDEINKKIKALPPKDLATVKLSQAAANLYAVKLAWRNEVMHPKDTYTLEEADNLIRQVQIFMEQLSTIV